MIPGGGAKRAGLTFEGFVGTFVTVLVRMGEKTQFSIGLLDLGVGHGRPRFLQAQDIVKGGGGTSSNADDGGLLFDGIFSFLVALFMLPVRGVVTVCRRVGPAGPGRGRRWHLGIVTTGIVTFDRWFSPASDGIQRPMIRSS